MNAVVVEAFGRPPRHLEFPEPDARADEVIVSVRSAALSQLVRVQAAGKHYSSGEPPFAPGRTASDAWKTAGGCTSRSRGHPLARWRSESR